MMTVNITSLQYCSVKDESLMIDNHSLYSLISVQTEHPAMQVQPEAVHSPRGCAASWGAMTLMVWSENDKCRRCCQIFWDVAKRPYCKFQKCRICNLFFLLGRERKGSQKVQIWV